jgi:hypothetical protein
MACFYALAGNSGKPHGVGNSIGYLRRNADRSKPARDGEPGIKRR